jgi:hypothetical protein
MRVSYVAQSSPFGDRSTADQVLAGVADETRDEQQIIRCDR